jgi:hypothetical protein
MAQATVEVQLQTNDASIGSVFNDDRLKRLPNFNRSATTLFTLQPASAPRGQYAGARSDESSYIIDGVNVTETITGGLDVPVPVESLTELRGTVVNANATFGLAPGAQLVMVTRSGGNQFHGGGYLYHQDRALNANSWTANRNNLKRPFLLDNRFGGTFGGPIQRDQTFIFMHYEGRRNPSSATVTRLVPQDSLRAGTLRFRDASGAVQTIDAATIRSLDPRGIGPNSKVLDYLNLYPRANNFTVGDGLNTAGFVFVAPVLSESNFGLVRLDHKLNQRSTLSGRFTATRDISTSAFQVSLQRQTALTNSAVRTRNVAMTLISVLSPNLTNEARGSWLHDRYDGNAEAPPLFVGLNSAINFASTLIDDLVDVDTQRARRQSGHSTVYQVSNISNWVNGSHGIQFGGNIQFIRSLIYRNDKIIGSLTDPVAEVGSGGFVSIPAAERPAFIQPSDVTRYNNLYASLLGMVNSVPALITRDGNLKQQAFGTGLLTDSSTQVCDFFLTDTWRMKPTLTLTYGLSYGWQTVPVEASGKQNVLSFADTGKPVSYRQFITDRENAARNGGIYNPDLAFVPIARSVRDQAFDSDYSNVSPRLALAWSPTFKSGWLKAIAGTGQTVFRGGYSLLYDRHNTVQSIQLPTLGAGFAQTVSITGPKNSSGQPFRIGVDGLIPLPSAPNVESSGVIPSKPFGELLSFSVDPDLRTPHNHVIDFTIQRELPWNLLLEVGYIGRMARNLYVGGNLNSVPIMQKDLASGQTFAQAYDAVATALRSKNSLSPQPYFENLYGAGTTARLANSFSGDFIVGNVNNIQQIALDLAAFQSGKGPVLTNLQVQSLSVRFSGASSNYNAFFATLHKRYSRGLTFDMNYTVSQFLDQVYIENQNSLSELQTSFSIDADYGAADADLRHLFNANGTYDLPFGDGHSLSFSNKALKQLVSGWFTAGVFTAQSGVALSVFQSWQAVGGSPVLGTYASAVPVSTIDAGESLHSGITGSNGVGINSDPARRGSGFNLFANPEAVYKNFRPILISQDGRTGRGVLRGLPRWNLNLTVGKQTNITEGVKFTLSFDFVNPFNHVIFGNPNLDLQNPASFGVLSNQNNSPRRIQIGARVDF